MNCVCRVCARELPDTEFSVCIRGEKEYRAKRCKACTNEAGRKWYSENKARRALSQRAWRQANRDTVNRLARKHQSAPKSRKRHKDWTREGAPEVEALIQAAKEVACVDCGINYHPILKDFDHRPGEIKRFNLSSYQGQYSRQSVLLELAKCDVVCANCHRERTMARIPRRDKARNAQQKYRDSVSFLINQLKSKPCERCGDVLSPWQKDFDHINPDLKVMHIGRFRRYGTKEKILEEIQKCRLLCANCHRLCTHLPFVVELIPLGPSMPPPGFVVSPK